MNEYIKIFGPPGRGYCFPQALEPRHRGRFTPAIGKLVIFGKNRLLS